MRATYFLVRRLLSCWTADVFVEGRAIATCEQLVEHVALRLDHRVELLGRLIHSVPGSHRFGVGSVAGDAIEELSIVVCPCPWMNISNQKARMNLVLAAIGE